MKHFLLFLLLFPVAGRADEVQLDHTFASSFSIEEAPQMLAFSPDGTKLAVAGSDGVKIYEASTGKVLETRAGCGIITSSVAWAPDGKALAAGGMTFDTGERGEIVLWRENASLLRWKTGGACIESLDFSPDGRQLATASSENFFHEAGRGAACLWDARNGNLLHNLGTYAASKAAIRFGPDNQVAFSSHYEYDEPDTKPTRVLDAITGRLIRRFDQLLVPIWWKSKSDFWPYSVLARQHQGGIERQVVRVDVKGAPHLVFVARNDSTQAILSRVELNSELACVQISGNLLATASSEGVRVWRTHLNSSSIEPLYTLNRTASPSQLGISGDRKTLGVFTSHGVLLLDAELNFKRLVPFTGSRENMNFLAPPLSFSRDGSQLWVGQWLPLAATTPMIVKEWGEATTPSPNGVSVVLRDSLIDEKKERIQLRIPFPEEDNPEATRDVERILRAHWRADDEEFVVACGSYSGSGSDDGFFVFDKAGRFKRALRQKDVFVRPRDAAFSPDGMLIATVGMRERYEGKLSQERSVSHPRLDLWNARTGQWLRSMTLESQVNVRFRSPAFFLSWSPDGKTLAVGGNVFSGGQLQNRLLFFDAATGRQVGSLPLSNTLFLQQSVSWAMLDEERVVILNQSALETWDWRAHKRLNRQFLVPDGNKIRLVASPN